MRQSFTHMCTLVLQEKLALQRRAVELEDELKVKIIFFLHSYICVN